jgi:HD-like signal output (HDOD) protein
LPSMSEVSHALIKSFHQHDVSIAEVRNILAKDAALSAKLLRIANSAQFGLPRGVGTLDEAITLIGMSPIRSLALGACLNDAFPTLPGLPRKDFWSWCMACGGYTQWMSARLGIDGQTAWLTGMMLRLGELLIVQAQPSTLQAIEAKPHTPGYRWKRELSLVGFTEGQITGELAHRWQFPMQIAQALQRASDPLTEQAFSRLGAVVHVAALLADTPHASSDAVAQLPQDVLDALELSRDWMVENFPASESFMDIATA